jgi:trimeric autotransporter adhesin
MTLRQVLSVLLVSVLLAVPGGALAQDGGPGAQSETAVVGSAFTYQGRLESGGSGVSATCGFEFGVWDDASLGAQVGVTQTVPSVLVNAGYFTTQLNSGNEFGNSAFNGLARWLAINVRCPDSGAYTPLSPRQALTAAPYALYAAGNWGLNGNAGTTANFLGTTNNVTLTLMVNGQTAFRLGPNATAVNIVGGAASNNIHSGAFGSIIGGGTNNVISPSVGYGVVAGGTANRAGNFEATVAGGQGNLGDGSFSFIGGGQSNHTFGNYSGVGSGVGNDAIAEYTTVAGGFGNQADAAGATIAGGRANRASGPGAFVGGGGWDGTTASGNAAWGDASAITGGRGNVITATSDYGFIAGGQNNSTSADYASVLGGQDNAAGGTGATVVGGRSNSADGNYSVALGYGAHADQSGSVVWTCGACPILHAGNADAAFFNSDNGFWFGRNLSAESTPVIAPTVFISTSSGAYLSTGGVWNNASDRNAKLNFAAVDGVAVLDTLMSIPLETWSYKVEDDAVRHLGPMAQDFYAAFGLGDSDTSIGTVDADGVALAAIQGLYTVVQEKEAEIAALKVSQADLDARLAALEAGAGTPGAANRGQLAMALVVGMLAGAAVGAGAFALGRRKGQA